ncbi:hypothetical protein GN956_G9397 [Arapaima gigas]
MQTARPVTASVVLLCGALALVCGDSCVPEDGTYICTSVPQRFPSGLTSLVLLVNDVGEINSTVFRSEALATVSSLTIANAGITAICPHSLYSFQQLRRLTLYQNSLSQISSVWLSQPDLLENLTLYENNLKILDEKMLQGFSGLRSLNLSRNKISTVATESFRTQESLIHLDLSGNQLVYISPEAFNVLRSTHFRLHNNPWDCSCKAEDFILLVQELANASRLDRKMDVTCATPVHLKGQPVWNVTKCLPPLPKPLHIGLPTLIGLLVLLCALVCGSCLLVVLCRQKLTNKQVEPESDPEVPTGSSWLEQEVSSTVIQGLEALKSSELCRGNLVRARANSAGAVLSTAEFPCKNSRTRSQINPGQSIFPRMEHKDRLNGPDASLSEEQNAVHHQEAGTLMFGVEGALPVSEARVELVCVQYPSRGKMEKPACEWETRTPEDRSTEKRQISEGTDTLPYLSIGTDPARQSPELPQHHHNNRGSFKRDIRRNSTWPPTSFQWKEKVACKSEVNHFLPGLVDKSEHKCENKTNANCYEQANFSLESRMNGFRKNMGTILPGGDMGNPKSGDCCPMVLTDISGGKRTPRGDLIQPFSQTQPVVADSTQLQSSQGQDPCEMGQSRQPGSRPCKLEKDKRKTFSSGEQEEGDADHQGGSTLLSRNARGSPADENLLQDNEYAFINLLHEVVQNQGRWTRDRWKQTHLNKQKNKQQNVAH